MTGRPDNTGTPSGGKQPAARDASRVLSAPMGGSITRRPKGGSQRQCASVEFLLHGVFRRASCLDELLEVVLHARLLGKRHRKLRGRTARQEDGLRPGPTQPPKVVGGHLNVPIWWTGNKRAQA